MAKKSRKKQPGKPKPQPADTPIAPAVEPADPADRRRHGQRLGACALSGCLWFLSCADFDIWPLAWIAAVPMLWAIDGAETRRRALLYAWVAGLVANVGGFYWITGLLTRFAHLPTVLALIGLLGLCAYQAVVFLLFAWCARGIRRVSAERLGAPLPWALVAPIAMVAFEMLVPFLFPWYLAITQAWVVPIIQIAELTGPVGVTALLMAVNGAIYDAIAERTVRRRALPAAGAALAVTAALVFGYVRIAQIDDQRAAAPGLVVGVVQGNVGFDEKGINNPQLAAQQLGDLQRLSRELAAGSGPVVDRFGAPMAEPAPADLIVWTESSYPYMIDRNLTGDVDETHPGRIRRGFDTPLIFGAVTSTRGAEYPYNTALMLDRSGTFVGRFDKIFLLMFGEYIPGLETFPWIRKILPKAAGHFARGEDIVTFPLHHDGADYRLGPMICYEDILPDFGRELAAMRPHLLVNITNDAWFGDTSEPWEHMALSVYRAVELRADLVRSVNTGVSAFIDANGRVYLDSYAMDPGIEDRGACAGDGACPGGYGCQAGRCLRAGMTAHAAEVTLMGGTAGAGDTVYAAVGDLFGWLCAAAALGLWLVWPRVRRRTA